MFIVFFALFILVITFTENIVLTTIVFLFLFWWVIIFSYFSIKKINKKTLIFLFLAFVIALSSMVLKALIYQYDYKNNTTYFIQTGEIVDAYNSEKYIFKWQDNKKYLLTTERKYKAGNEIWLNAYFYPANTGLNNFFDILYQTKNIEQLSFSWFLNYQFDYPKWLQMKWFAGTLYEQKSIILWEEKIDLIAQTKKIFKQKIISSYWENRVAGLILWMLIWDRSQIPSEDYTNFINSSLVHIIAVSGQNIIMLVLFLSFVLFFIPFYPRNIIIWITILFYALLCGLDSSIFRATLMALLWITAIFFGRGISIWRSLSIVFILMLIVNPYFLVYDVWFILSFSAIIWLIYFQKNDFLQKLYTKKFKSKIKRSILVLPIKDYLHPTLSATLWTFPIIVFFIGKINLMGMFANLLILPIVPLVMIYGFFSVYLYQIFYREFILNLEKLLINYIYRISEFTVNHWIYLTVQWNWIKYFILLFFLIIFLKFRFKKEKEE